MWSYVSAVTSRMRAGRARSVTRGGSTMPTNPRSRPWFLVAAVLALFGILLAACGGGSDSSDDDGSGEDDATAITVAASGPAQAGGSLVMGVEAETDGFN